MILVNRWVGTSGTSRVLKEGLPATDETAMKRAELVTRGDQGRELRLQAPVEQNGLKPEIQNQGVAHTQAGLQLSVEGQCGPQLLGGALLTAHHSRAGRLASGCQKKAALIPGPADLRKRWPPCGASLCSAFLGHGLRVAQLRGIIVLWLAFARGLEGNALTPGQGAGDGGRDSTEGTEKGEDRPQWGQPFGLTC